MLKSDKSLPETLSNLASEIFDAINFKKPNLDRCDIVLLSIF